MRELTDLDQQVITNTTNWIRKLVIGCNFCPFAARELQQNSIHFRVEHTSSRKAGKLVLLEECTRLDENPAIGTTLIIFPQAFPEFDRYLEFLHSAETLLLRKGYEGIYQLASFHPQYQFNAADDDDPANYTNRSIYPMLHLLREESITKAIAHYPHADQIPQRNINFARDKGTAYLQMLRDSCM